MWYFLKDKIPTPATCFEDLEKEYGNPNRILAKTKIGDQEVSTVFLMIDHNFLREGDPILFETMIFPECDYCVRARTYDEAMDDHKIACESLRTL